MRETGSLFEVLQFSWGRQMWKQRISLPVGKDHDGSGHRNL